MTVDQRARLEEIRYAQRMNRQWDINRMGSRLAERVMRAEADAQIRLASTSDPEASELWQSFTEALAAVTWLLEHWPEDEDPGPGIRAALARWRRAAGLCESACV